MKNSLKFAFFMCYFIGIFFLQDGNWLVILFVLNFLFMKIIKLQIRNFGRHLKLLLPFVLFTAWLNILFGSFRMGILIGVRLVIAYQITYLFSKCMTSIELANVIQNLAYPLKIFKIDNEKIGLIVRISFCVIPILKNEMEQKRYALKAKGARFDLKNILRIIEPIFISILRRTNEMEKSLKSKGYEE